MRQATNSLSVLLFATVASLTIPSVQAQQPGSIASQASNVLTTYWRLNALEVTPGAAEEYFNESLREAINQLENESDIEALIREIAAQAYIGTLRDFKKQVPLVLVPLVNSIAAKLGGVQNVPLNPPPPPDNDPFEPQGDGKLTVWDVLGPASPRKPKPSVPPAPKKPSDAPRFEFKHSTGKEFGGEFGPAVQPSKPKPKPGRKKDSPPEPSSQWIESGDGKPAPPLIEGPIEFDDRPLKIPPVPDSVVKGPGSGKPKKPNGSNSPKKSNSGEGGKSDPIPGIMKTFEELDRLIKSLNSKDANFIEVTLPDGRQVRIYLPPPKVLPTPIEPPPIIPPVHRPENMSEVGVAGVTTATLEPDQGGVPQNPPERSPENFRVPDFPTASPLTIDYIRRLFRNVPPEPIPEWRFAVPRIIIVEEGTAASSRAAQPDGPSSASRLPGKHTIYEPDGAGGWIPIGTLPDLHNVETAPSARFDPLHDVAQTLLPVLGLTDGPIDPRIDYRRYVPDGQGGFKMEELVDAPADPTRAPHRENVRDGNDRFVAVDVDAFRQSLEGETLVGPTVGTFLPGNSFGNPWGQPLPPSGVFDNYFLNGLSRTFGGLGPGLGGPPVGGIPGGDLGGGGVPGGAPLDLGR